MCNACYGTGVMSKACYGTGRKRGFVGTVQLWQAGGYDKGGGVIGKARFSRGGGVEGMARHGTARALVLTF